MQKLTTNQVNKLSALLQICRKYRNPQNAEERTIRVTHWFELLGLIVKLINSDKPEEILK